MGQCKCTQTAIYKGVPKAVGGKEKQSVKNLSEIWIRKWKTSKMYFFPNKKMALKISAIRIKGKDTSTAKTLNIYLSKDS